jgi:hypothetical protein
MQSKYQGLDKLERTAAASLAVSAAIMVDAGRCPDTSGSGSAAETILFAFEGIGRKVFQPIFDLPQSRKSLLIDFAMEVESQRQPAQDLTDVVCHHEVLPESKVMPLSQRRAGARQLLAMALSPPKPEPPASLAE